MNKDRFIELLLNEVNWWWREEQTMQLRGDDLDELCNFIDEYHKLKTQKP